MTDYLEIINKILALGTIFLQVTVLFLAINLIFFRKQNNLSLKIFKKYTLVLGFLIALGAVLLSLFYSEVVGYPPCSLCWIQRIFLYPQLILFGLGLYKKDKSMIDYSLVLAVLGAITSFYHIYVENGGTVGVSCNTGEASCAIRYIYEFGYITMPIMALTLSLFIIMILLNHKYFLKNG